MKVTDEMIQQWVQWEKERIPQSEMAQRSNVSVGTVQRYLKIALNKPKYGKFSHIIKEKE